MSADVLRLADEHAIGKLVLAYATGADKRDGALFASVFTPDGILELDGRQTAGRDKLARIPKMLEAYVKTYHTVLNTSIDVAGDTAIGEVYSASHHLRPLDGNAYSDRIMHITYRDSYVRTAEGWRIAHRLVDTEFVEYRTVLFEDRGGS